MMRDSLSVAAETTYGTFATPARSHLINTESLKPNRNRYKGKGRSGTKIAQSSSLIAETTRTASGDVDFDPTTKGLGIWLNLLNGDTNTSSGAGTAKTWTFGVGVTPPGPNKSLTAQIGIEDVDGTRQAKSVVGAVIEQASWSVAQGEILKQKFTLQAQDLRYTDALAATAYATNEEVFGYAGATVKLGGVAVTDTLVRSAEINVALPRNKERFGLNGSALAAYPVVNDLVAVSGKMTVEFRGLTQANALINATLRAFNLTCNGVTDVQSGIKGSLQFDVPLIRVTDATPASDDGDLETFDIEWEAEAGASALMTITYVTTDTAL